MLKYKNIHSRVQGELKKKINAITRERLDNTGQTYFIGWELEQITTPNT